jgi:hypothetical protein
MGFLPREIYYVNCDQRGRNTNYDGFLNSNNGKERPFLIISGIKLNNSCKNDGIYALPLTSSGKGGAFAETFDNESLESGGNYISFSTSVILCDKICRIGSCDLHQPEKIAKITLKKYKIVLNKVGSFVKNALVE